MKSVRTEALETLNKAEKNSQYASLAIDAAQKRGEIPEADRGLFTALVYGVTERKLTLDFYIDQLSSLPAKEISAEVRNLLRLGIYQLKFMDRIPDHAAVNETVAASPKKAAGFVNAILREFLRRGKEIPLPTAWKPAEKLSVSYSVCLPLVEKLIASFGIERAESLLRAYGERIPTCLRVNDLKTTRDALLSRLLAAGYDASLAGTHGIHVFGNAPVTSMPGFSEGHFFVQDLASQFTVDALGAAPGMKVLDVCACPGSKSFGAAMSMANRGEILSCDLHASKLSLVEKGASRLGISILSVAERDARDPFPDWICAADRVICDVPCSGFGVLAKKPELRYKNPAESASLPSIQSSILAAASRCVRPSGRLVYSTCTIFPEENSLVVSSFLSSHPDFSLLSSHSFFPDLDRVDGFFCAVLEKK